MAEHAASFDTCFSGTASATQTISLQGFWTNAFSKRNQQKGKDWRDRNSRMQHLTPTFLYTLSSSCHPQTPFAQNVTKLFRRDWDFELSMGSFTYHSGRTNWLQREAQSKNKLIDLANLQLESLGKRDTHYFQRKSLPPHKKNEDHMILSIFSNPNDQDPLILGTRCGSWVSLNSEPSHLIVAVHSIGAHRIPPFPDRRLWPPKTKLIFQRCDVWVSGSRVTWAPCQNTASQVGS